MARGQQWPLEQKQRTFSEATQRSRFHRGAHQQMLQALTPKWGGPEGAALALAEQVLEQAPPGHGIQTLLADAWLEEWLWLRMQGKQEIEARRLFAQPHARSQLKRALEASVLHPDALHDHNRIPDLNRWAMTMWLAGDFQTTSLLLEQMGGRVTSHPWAYMDSEVFGFFSFAADTTRAECARR